MADGTPKTVLQDDILSSAYGVPLKAVENPLTGHIEVFSSIDDAMENTGNIDDFLMGGRRMNNE